MKYMGSVFVPVPRHEGYYWNIKTQTLWSTKQRGKKPPRELKFQPFNEYQFHYYHRGARRTQITEEMIQGGWNISRNGCRGFLHYYKLVELNDKPTVRLVKEDDHFVDREDLFKI